MQVICTHCGYRGEAYVAKKNPHYGIYCSNCGRWIRWVSITQGQILLEQQEARKQK